MLKVLTGESSKVYENRKNRDRTINIMCKYAQLKRFLHYRWLQVYMYDFMYVDPQTIPVEDNFTDTKKVVVTYNKMSNP